MYNFRYTLIEQSDLLSMEWALQQTTGPLNIKRHPGQYYIYI